jgi:hypothetical protein
MSAPGSLYLIVRFRQPPHSIASQSLEHFQQFLFDDGGETAEKNANAAKSVDLDNPPIREDGRGWILYILINDCSGLEFSDVEENNFHGRSGENGSDGQIICRSGSESHSAFLTFHSLQ